MAHVIMVQGTMSNAGKSLVAAGLCRIFKQDGFRVAPFKSQNMALNSYITKDGLEMGRAQVVQAEAAGVEPDAAMNPILLKPTTDVGSQVIVNGIAIGNMKAREYFAFKKQLIPEIQKAFAKLSEEYDIIVIEGAGSPAEINLKQDDIVNMGMAKMADAPVILVGDIDRGGVFAQLYGTVMLLEKEERERIAGLLINKFRGDASILTPGIRMIEELCQIPVIGVVPYMQVDLEDEDSLSSRLERKEKKTALVCIAVIRLPRMSNFTDFQVFDTIPEVDVRYITSPDEIEKADLIILPGTKSTIEDLLWMRQNGLEAAVKKAHARKVPVFGICGGYQMLGMEIRDESGVEGETAYVRGMELLPVKTTLETEKVRTLAQGFLKTLDGDLHGLSGKKVEGYEIHMGQTRMQKRTDEKEGFYGNMADLQVIQDSTDRPKQDGCFGENVYGTYLHGFFDSYGIASAVTQALVTKKGLDAGGIKEYSYSRYKEVQFDLLADTLRKSLDMKRIYECMKLTKEPHTGSKGTVKKNCQER